MNIVQFNGVDKDYAGEILLKDISFSIDDKDKIGLIGLNGAGKTSIIKMILEEEKISFGNVYINKNVKIAYLSQNHVFTNEENSVLDELKSVFSEIYSLYERLKELSLDEENIEEYNRLNSEYISKDGYNIDYLINQVIYGLELDKLQEYNINSLSGGQKTRVLLAKLLLEKPDLLILDEPTNHLDIASIEWLEDYLKKYNKAFLLVSHDRIFLDNVCNRIFEIENKKLYKYKGNFSDFILQKEMIIKGELKAYEKEQDRIKKLEEYIERNRAGRQARQAKGREKILNRIERSDSPIFNPKRMKLKFDIKYASGENVMKVKKLSKSFGNEKILDNIDLEVYKGQKIGIIGKNGCGKSTLLKILASKLNEYSGEIEIGNKVKLAYYDQNHENLNPSNDILGEINTSINYTNEYLRGLAGAFLFTEDDVLKKISSLSGGEKVRVSFIKLLQEEANFLILDEPTNHLDIYSIEVLEQALENYEGTILLVSHNRYFLDSICDNIYVLDEKGLTHFKGNYEQYKESLKNVNNKQYEESKKEEYIKQKEYNKKISKLKKDVEKYEKDLEDIAIEKENLNKLMYNSQVSSNIEKLMEIQEKLDKLNEKEENILLLWQEASEFLEKNESM